MTMNESDECSSYSTNPDCDMEYTYDNEGKKGG